MGVNTVDNTNQTDFSKSPDVNDVTTLAKSYTIYKIGK